MVSTFDPSLFHRLRQGFTGFPKFKYFISFLFHPTFGPADNLQAAEIVLKLVFSWLNTSSNANRVDQIILTTFLDDSGVYETLFPVVFGSQEGSTAAAL